jgi:hypothetical protein
VADFPPARPAAPGTTPDSVPGARRRRSRTWFVLLLGTGAVALLAGLIWVLATGSRPGPASPGTSAASPGTGQLARFQVTRIRVAAGSRGVRVRWSPPSGTADVIAFIAVAELGGRVQQERTVGPAGHSAVFAGLRAGRRYCFVVGTVVEPAGGRAGTATAPAVCKVIR